MAVIQNVNGQKLGKFWKLSLLLNVDKPVITFQLYTGMKKNHMGDQKLNCVSPGGQWF